MSAPVDVLAVMDADASVLRSEMRRRNRKAMRSDHPEAAVRQERMKYLLAQNAEARAAVAELIEADKEYDTARSRYDHAFCDGPRGDMQEQRLAQKMLREAKERRAAVLARIQGGA